MINGTYTALANGLTEGVELAKEGKEEASEIWDVESKELQEDDPERKVKKLHKLESSFLDELWHLEAGDGCRTLIAGLYMLSDAKKTEMIFAYIGAVLAFGRVFFAFLAWSLWLTGGEAYRAVRLSLCCESGWLYRLIIGADCDLYTPNPSVAWDLEVADRSYVLFVNPSTVFDSLVPDKPDVNAFPDDPHSEYFGTLARGFAHQNTFSLIVISVLALTVSLLMYVILKLVYEWLSVRTDFVTAMWRHEEKHSWYVISCLNGLMFCFSFLIEGLLGLLTSIFTSVECASERPWHGGMFRARYIEVGRVMCVAFLFGFIALLVLVPPLTLAWACAHDLLRRGEIRSPLHYVKLIIFVLLGAMTALYPLATVIWYIATIAHSGYRFLEEWTVGVTTGVGTSCWSESEERFRSTQVMVYIVAVLTWLGYLNTAAGFLGKHLVAYLEREKVSDE